MENNKTSWCDLSALDYTYISLHLLFFVLSHYA